jgi:hypothetical protein
MMLLKVFTIGFLLLGAFQSGAEQVQAVIDHALSGLEVVASDEPYSRTLQRMFIGWDDQKNPRIGVVYREIESYKPITGVVIVEKTAEGFVLKEALFPDIGKIRSAKDRKEVLTVLKQFKNIPFDPHAEKSAVDGLTGATRYGIKTSGYLNYMARRVALEMESQPAWTKPKK